jgi:ADP-dependent NAD(P)H-hydrate dehydratase / NAD(P)H-hydrate epimerase
MRDWDGFTMEHEPIASIDLMERAARECVAWILARFDKKHYFKIFCGKGNNGGDGLAIARLLLQNGFALSVYILESGKSGSPDFEHNLRRLQDMAMTDITYLRAKEDFPLVNTNDILVDAIFGTGLSKPLEGIAAELVQYINHSRARVVSIDLPSGLFTDQTSKNNTVIEADDTLTFQTYKTGLLFAENAPFSGNIHVLDIGLHPGFLSSRMLDKQWVDSSYVHQLYRPRNAFAHKGQFGHALLIAGSYGKMGAAVLAAGACMHSGVGLLTCLIPRCGYEIMQIAVPEAMVIADEEENFVAALPGEMEKYSVIGIGPGLGTADATKKLISFIVRRYQSPLVVDADGLNCLAQEPALLTQLPAYSILTPHPKEFDRLFGDHATEFERMEKARQKAMALRLIIVLKGHHTLVATPNGNLFFNSTGNAGMAKGGSGDVLTGIITALVAQRYEPETAAIMGVYLHGLAGDLQVQKTAMEALTASDIITGLSLAFLRIRSAVHVKE